MSPSFAFRALLLGVTILLTSSSVGGVENVTYYTEKLVKKYGDGDLLTPAQAQHLLLKVRELSSTHFPDKNSTAQCMNAEDLFSFHDLPKSGANIGQVSTLASGLLYQLQNEACDDGDQEKKTPSLGEAWGYSMLATTIINICPLLGLFFYPIMKTRWFKIILMCTVGFAVGTLSASAILVLIPEGFELLSDHSPFADIVTWRGMTVIAGLFIFFNIERCLSIIFLRKEELNDPGSHSSGEGKQESQVESNWRPASEIKPVAWMIIIGDAIHNFMDGLAIGSAFRSDSAITGLGISLAILSEELPHELGDFAVLLNAGMSLKQAAMMNFISALSSYLGVIVGIQVGEIQDGAYWVYAITGGMFLYIALVEMLPEMNQQAAEEEERTGQIWVVFVVQNIGLIVGWFVIFFVAHYGDNFPA